jgi:uncharacterized protein
VRTIAEVSNYVYSISDEGLWINLYGGNQLTGKLKDGSTLRVSQVTEYPWNGHVTIHVEEAPSKDFSVFLRIPGWSKGVKILVNGKAINVPSTPGTYAQISRNWKRGDKIVLQLPMEVTLLESHPLVEETRNQVTVKRGPVVYCLESPDIPKEKDVFSLAIPLNAKFTPQRAVIGNSDITLLSGKVRVVGNDEWNNRLYKEVSKAPAVEIPVRLVPYYAWGNRGHSEMTVWMPVSR